MILKSEPTDRTRSTTLSWRLQGARLPKVFLTMRVAKAARAMVIRKQICRTGTQILPDCLHGPTTTGNGMPHQHAFWLPEDRDRDGRLDHLTVHVPQGVTAETLDLLDTPDNLIVERVGDFSLSPAHISPGLLGTSRAWVSVTPFLGPRHAWKETRQKDATLKLKAGRGAVEQLKFELARLRGGTDVALQKAEIIPMPPGSMPPMSEFKIERKRNSTPANPVGGYFFVEFEVPVNGLLSVGLGSHFGLGQFRPFWSVPSFDRTQRHNTSGSAAGH